MINTTINLISNFFRLILGDHTHGFLGREGARGNLPLLGREGARGNLPLPTMLCCGGKQDPGGRDMKSAQNTPSRQPLVVHQKQQQQDNMGNLAPPPGGDFKKVRF